jgi:hypothetical protein
MISSASAQIEAIGGQHLETTIIRNGKPTVVPDYATVQGILLGAVSAFVIFITIIGPECVSCLCHPSKLRNADFPGVGTTGRTLSHRRPRSREAAQRIRASQKTKRNFRA